MARAGSFSGPTFQFGAPLEIVHPPDNQFPLYDPEIEGLAGATPEERAKLQAELDALFAVLVTARDGG